MLRALSSRNYRLYFGGQIVSITGTWMQQVALAWLVYRLTDSTLMVGVTAFVGQIPNLLLAPVGGVISDRFPRRRLLVITQSLCAAQALTLTVLAHLSLLTPLVIVGMALVLGVINGVDQPIRQSFVPELIERREDIANAVALNSFTIHTSRVLGAALGGLALMRFGESTCFLLNAISYGCVIVALLMMTTQPVEPVGRSVHDALREGLSYVGSHRAIRLLLMIVATMALFSGSYQTLLPYYARTVYHGDATALGFMNAAGGLGACLGTLFLASRRGADAIERRIVFCAVVVAVALTVFATVNAYSIAILAMIVMGFCSINTVAASNALIQVLVENAMRGRVMAIFSMAFFGLSPVGNLLVGWAARVAGARLTLLSCAALVMAMSLFALRSRGRIDFSFPAVEA
jgi:MFS family permease